MDPDKHRLPNPLPDKFENQTQKEPGTAVRKNGFVKDGLTIIDRGALPGVLKRPVATLSAVAAAKFNQATAFQNR